MTIRSLEISGGNNGKQRANFRKTAENGRKGLKNRKGFQVGAGSYPKGAIEGKSKELRVES
jgi:hypothetical protein